MNKGIWVAAAAAGVLAIPSVASAQEARNNFFNRQVLAPSNALEIAVNGGYSQAVGDIRPGSRIQDIGGAGGAVGLEAGFRATPMFFVGAYGQYGQYGNQTPGSATIRDATAGLEAAAHFAPYSGMDPWVGLGSGWHGLWVDNDNAPNASYQGWQIARLRVGADFRATNEVALGPVVGASANIYLTEKLPGDTGFHNVSSPHVNVQFFAGLSGRFDMAGTSVARGAPASMASR